MKHLKLFFALFAMLALGVGNAWAEEAETLACPQGTVSNNTMTWELTSCTIVHAKGNSTSALAAYTPWRIYKNSTVTFTPKANVTISAITITVQNTTDYKNATKDGTWDNASISMSNNIATVTPTDGTSSIKFTSSSAQTRWSSITITYEAGSSTPKQKYTLTYQAGSVTGSLEVEEGANLLDALKDITPVACDPTSTEPIGWSESEITTKQANAPTLLTDASVMPSKEHSVYYVFAKKETTGGGAATEKTGVYTFANYTAGTQYAKNEEHKLDDDVTIYTTDCHFTTQLRIYSSTTNNGYVVSNELPGKIVSMSFNLGYKTDKLNIYGSTDGSTWNNVDSIETTTSYADKSIDFGEANYTYFKLDVAGTQQVRIAKMSITYMSGGGTTTISDYTTSCSNAPAATLVSIAHTGNKTTFTEGDPFVKSTITATYDDENTKDVTSLATFEGYDMNTTGTQTVNVSYTEGDKTATTTYNITVNPKPTYTITWNNAGSTNKTTVVQGEAFGELPTVADCPNGKKFMGWSATNDFASDGSDINYVKKTDVPTSNTTYYAVFAVVEGGNGTPTTATVTIADYATANGWASGTQYNTMNIDANITATAAGGGNTGKYYSSGSGTWRFYQNEAPSLTISAAAGYEIQTVKMTYTIGNTGVLTLDGSQIASEAACEINAVSVTFSVGNTTSATNGNVQVSAIEVVYAPAAKKSDYSPNCDIHQDPYLTLLETEINFGTVAQNETVTETLNVSGGYLAEDVTLTISGTNASFFSVNPTTIAKADELDQDVTITYNPTATGEHTATLTIKTGDITKTVALSGTVLAPGKWVLVKNVTELSAGDEVIIASSISNYAIGTAASNNYKGAAITKVGETANTTAEVTILTVEETGVAEAPYAFKTDGKYLYAAGSSANQLKAQATNNENGQWAVAITDGVASIVAAKSSNRNVMQCNPNGGSPIFACYSSADYEALAIYRNSENVVKPVISGEADFVGSTQVTITAQSGLTVYYTTDGNTPDKTSNSYSAPFTINATTTVKAIAYDAADNASAVAEMTFTKHDLVNVATAMALAKDEIAYFDEFEVVKVVAGKGNIYIKDASGHGLIYDFTLATQLSDGDRVQGFVGISSPYSGLPEAKPYNVTYEDLTITAGTPAEPYDFTATAITETDINKYIVFQNVEITENTDMSTNPTLTIGGNSVDFYNQFGVSKTLEAGKIYDIYGFVAIKDDKLDVYFYEAAQDGEVIQKYTVTYNAGGATGTVPVDNAEYSEGAQVYLKSATDLTYEGYEYKGWKVTDANGTEIPVSSNKFNMPASNVTVTAQWEAIVVTPKEDFSAGVWVLVSDANELAADDYIIVAAKDYNVAMVSYDYDVRKNNCGQTNITKFGKDNCFLTWTEDVGVFQLTASGENYTIQDVNTKQYLYAAGGTTSNHLKATDAVDTDAENMPKYIWEISIVDGITTVKAMSKGRNTLKYNSTATSGQLFSCYASGQKDIVLYKYTTDFYTRDVTKNQYGTICLDKGGVPVSGATFYEVAYKNTQTKRVLVDEVVRLKAGVPYVFLPNATQIKIALDGTTAGTASKVNGLQGTFEDITDGPAGTAGNILEGKHVLYNNAIQKCGGNCQLPAYRAYFLVDEITTTEPAQVPGRRRVALDYQGENQATGLDNIGAPENDAVKVLMNGQMIIIRNGEKFNAQGVKL